MRLIALRLLGFKSFPDATELRFGPGVTAIVGPNGSGKSNIVDAIRWVLGEQNTRALRSPRVPDLIFNGTAHRKPLGMGQVTLVIDNSDETIPLEYSEINIMRRVHRSGEGEFFINGTPCRLRDIQHLLLGTGLGRGGMAVIGQGEVDAILSADPAARRLLIEETAGTSRYTAQKRLAEQRLERAAQDLTRVRDLSAELTARAAVLEDQAKVAARWREVNASLQAHRSARAAREWLAARARLEEAQQELLATRQRLEEAERAAETAAAAAMQAQEATRRLREELEQARAALHAAETDAGAARHKLELATLQWESSRQRLEALEGELSRLEAEGRESGQRVDAAREELTREQAAVQELVELEAAAARRLEQYDAAHAHGHARLEALREELLAARQSASLCVSELQRLEAEAARRAAERERWQATVAEMEQRLIEAEAALEQARRDSEAAARAVQGRRDEAQRLALMLQAARSELDQRRRALEAARTAVQEAQAHRRALLRLEEEHVGYRPAVRAVLGAAAQLGGIRGTVAQLLDVPARYETAIQAALGAAAQNIVVDDEKAVQRAIEFLRARRAGRATFMALDTVRPRPWPDDARHVLRRPGVVGVAAELVETEAAVRPVVDYLLGRILVVATLPEAQAIARQLHSGLRIVTLTGEMLVPGGPVTGGSDPSQETDGLVSRRRELREWEAKERQAAAQLSRCQDALRAASEQVEALEQTAAASQDDAQRDALRLAELRQRVAQAEADVARAAQALREARDRLAELEQRGAEEVQRSERLRADAAAFEQRARELQEEVERLAAASREEEATRRRLADELAEVRTRLAARQEALRATQRDVERWLAAGEQIEERKRRLLQQRTEIDGELKRLGQALAVLRDELPAREQAVAAARERLEQATAALSEAQQRDEQARIAAEDADQEVAAWRERAWGAEATAARHAAALESAAQRLAELELAPEQAEEVAALERASARAVRELEEELQALGPVNLGAEQELAELRERLDFLKAQQEDLERAAAGLEQAIRRLDKLSEERFEDTFQRVARHFSETFRRLFGGGKAELTLLEDGGVDVHVQMPGKRSQNLLALSGGERALTAIALLFALLKVQPSPFYVLDEIDSALDEANLGRFQTLLREAAQDAQFIVITHRATTMETADTLYGVTAAEAGVSTVVSLSLQEAVATVS